MKTTAMLLAIPVALSGCASLGVSAATQACIVDQAVAVVLNDGLGDDLQAEVSAVAAGCGVDFQLLVADAIKAALMAASETARAVD